MTTNGTEATTPTILICDDDHTASTMLVAFLEARDLTAASVATGADLLLQVRRSRPDVIVLDLGLPDIDGLEILTMLKAQERVLGRRLRIIVLTGNDAPETAERAMEAGAFYFFTKPTPLEHIARHIELALEQTRIERSYIPRDVHVSCTPEEFFDQLIAATMEEAPQLDARRFPLDPRTVIASAPELAGVLVLRDAEDNPLLVEWSENVQRRLTFYVALSPSASPLRAAATTFEYVLSESADMAGTLFDKLYNETGAFPRFTPRAPAGSKYHETEEHRISHEQHATLTAVATPRDDAELRKVEAMAAQSPNNPELQDWLAFRYLSHGELQKAITAYRSLCAGKSSKPEHYFYLGNALYKSHQYLEAIECWEKVAKQGANRTLARKAQLRLNGAKKKHNL